MRILVSHTTRLDYEADVVESVMDARLGPRTDQDQRWDSFDLGVQPPGSVRRYGDAFGNTAHLITFAKAHRSLEVVAHSEVETLLLDPFASPQTSLAPLAPGELADYLGPSALVPRHPEIDDLAAPHRPESPDSTFGAVQELTRLVYREFTYKPDVTTVATDVPELLRTRTGVCQDLAHVLLGLCRSVGIPARYVSGYIVTDADGPKRGAGHSHAWVEAFTPTHGWRGFDPTNDLIASEHHVKMAVGRDYRDVPPTQGTFRGAADERLVVEVAARRRGEPVHFAREGS